MKNLVVFTVISTFTFFACNSNADTHNHQQHNEHQQGLYACPMHPEVTGNKGDECSKCGMELTEPVASSQNQQNVEAKPMLKEATFIDPIVSAYIALKNAFTKDDSEGIVKSSKLFIHQVSSLDVSKLSDAEKQEVATQSKELTKALEQILANNTEIEKQRLSFEKISQSMTVLVEKFGSNQVLYQQYCPMYNEDKGGAWLSESKEVLNPYFGHKMLKCGMVKKQL